MTYNFDQIIDRSGTSAIKLDGLQPNWGRTDLIPLWVADMDLPTAPFIIEAIQRRLQNPILGYTYKSDSYYQAIINWVRQRYSLNITQDMINYVPGIVPGIAMAVNCFTRPGDRIIIQPPVYHPFAGVTQRNARTVVTNPLILQSDGTYRMDLAHFRQQAHGAAMFILCNPHNPGGIVWNEEELHAIADICHEENVLVISDEIHADLTLPPHQHHTFANISEKARNNSVTFMSPSKAFNMPGLSASHAIIPNATLMSRFKEYMEAGELDMGHVFAFPAVEAAYSHGTEWLEQCLAYLQSNIDYIVQFLRTNTPKIKALPPAASYLVWLDCRDMKLCQTELNRFFIDKAHLALNDGAMFGTEGTGFMRLNAASPRSVIDKAMQQLKQAYEEWDNQ